MPSYTTSLSNYFPECVVVSEKWDSGPRWLKTWLQLLRHCLLTSLTFWHRNSLPGYGPYSPSFFFFILFLPDHKSIFGHISHSAAQLVNSTQGLRIDLTTQRRNLLLCLFSTERISERTAGHLFLHLLYFFLAHLSFSPPRLYLHVSFLSPLSPSPHRPHRHRRPGSERGKRHQSLLTDWPPSVGGTKWISTIE